MMTVTIRMNELLEVRRVGTTVYMHKGLDYLTSTSIARHIALCIMKVNLIT